MDYRISYTQPHRHFIDIEATADAGGKDTLDMQLPAWRPGRYELADFAKNIQKWEVFDEKGSPLNFQKITKDRWQIECKGAEKVVVRYNYFAKVLDGGSTYLNDTQLYVNPVNCLIYQVDEQDLPCKLSINIPKNYEVATGLTPEGDHWKAASFHQLADSPFIASANLQHGEFVVEGVLFHLWFQGEFKPDWEKIIHQFSQFTKVQMSTMGEFPVKEYHFLFQITTHASYHGVEHGNSTVILLGPSYDILNDKKWRDFLGVSSHELFHTWNVKALRPVEMQPYDYSRENYTKLGFVAEGVTTYYGDLFLYRSKGFTDLEYFKELHQLFQRHFHNYGRFNLSVADSSFDTWLDGYEKGIPHRKTSIYTKGALVALMLDLTIRKETNSKYSLDDVMRLMYEQYGKTGKGYSEQDYLNTANSIAGVDLTEFFNKYYYDTSDLLPELKDLLSIVGLKIKETPSGLYYENRFGFKTRYINGRSAEIIEVAPDSIADKAEMKVGDELISINGIRILGNLNEWCNYFKEETITLTINAQNTTQQVALTPNEELYYLDMWPEKLKDPSPDQKKHFAAWASREF